jgi:L-lactate dehydrogenase (cytochrome)
MLAGNLDRCLNVEDFRRAARRRAHRMVFDYIDGGADDEVTLRRNGSAFNQYDLVFRVLTGNDAPDLSVTLMGQKLDVPFFLSPAAGNRLFHIDGEAGPALAAADVGTAYCLSTLSSISIEDIGALTSGPKWFQLYVWRDRVLVKEMLDRARKAGFSALVLTVDFPITGNRERDPRNGFTIPPRLGFKQVWHALQAPMWSLDYITSPAIRYANISTETPATTLNAFVAEKLSAKFDWSDAEWLLGEWNGPAMLKGVVAPDDARRAVQTGFKAISISNHGGRQLDGSPAPLDCLTDIRSAVGGDVDLVLDGGVRRGTDVLKALALGATAVSFARPYLYGLAAGGRQGAKRVVRQIADSVKRDMILCGVSAISQLNETYVRHRR